jgi:hypothetical protein
MVSKQLVAIINGYDSQVKRNMDAVIGQIESMWDGLPNYNKDDIVKFANRAIKLLTAANLNTLSQTSAYLAALQSAATGQPFQPPGLSRSVVALEALRGTDPMDTYQRPGVVVWTALRDGKELSQATHLGKLRAVAIAATDMQLAKTHTAREFMARDSRVTRYKRVLNGDDCALCITAADNTYSKSDLLPIHPGCNCSVSPVFGASDPAKSINKSNASGEDKVPIEIREHGEIGPMLTRAGDAFTTPDDF